MTVRKTRFLELKKEVIKIYLKRRGVERFINVDHAVCRTPPSKFSKTTECKKKIINSFSSRLERIEREFRKKKFNFKLFRNNRILSAKCVNEEREIRNR